MFNIFCKKNYFIVWIIIALLLPPGCKTGKNDIDVSHINISLNIKNFEKDIFSMGSENQENQFVGLKNKYSLFLPLFCERIIKIGPVDDPASLSHIQSFITDPDIVKINVLCRNVSVDFNKMAPMLEESFKRYHYYFPEKKIPEVITFISGFNYSIIAADGLLGIGLDMYLGEKNEYYAMLGIPQYKAVAMSSRYIIADCIRGWGESEFTEPGGQKQLIDLMIYHGKILYLTDVLLPETDAHLKMSYTPEQIKWCNENESQIWAYFIDKKLLYSSDHRENMKYIGEAPFTPGFPKGSPGRTGRWLGWQIVIAYMNKNPSVSLSQLMSENDARKIFANSGYRPGGRK